MDCKTLWPQAWLMYSYIHEEKYMENKTLWSQAWFMYNYIHEEKYMWNAKTYSLKPGSCIAIFMRKNIYGMQNLMASSMVHI